MVKDMQIRSELNDSGIISYRSVWWRYLILIG